MITSQSLTHDEVGILLSSAVHAPSMHNTQPWRFEIHGPVVDVLLDEQRALPVADPARRLLRIGLGAAAFNVRVAAAMLGRRSTFAAEPDPARPDIAARIFLGDRFGPVPELSGLYGELRRRHTYRGPMLRHRVAPQVLALLDKAIRAEGGRLHWLDESQLGLLGGIVAEADKLDAHEDARREERLRWVGGDREQEGIPDTALGPLAGEQDAVRDMAAGRDAEDRGAAVFEDAPLITVLSTPDEDAPAWLRAGLALQRMWLTATSYDLAASFLNQTLEHPDHRQRVRELIGRGWPQMVIRLGYPAQDVGRAARADWRDRLL